ncbi:hypothetical protein NP233_g5428 [Leucocoprinus birnbaumii]|uniref:Mitochondrial zinc maintenance protein 1, mitochondrial n=1 Tax=Leucocoprinus birnbaumii TaxID=56174 RepID=A0AAD5YQZ0_9AGAR|nr:hypothetical protein NP233_g5428 [Leucocoprinus birnbaumii]
MSVTPTLRAAARSAYRDLYRAASATFTGDEQVLIAFRQKMRADAIKAQAVTIPEEYQQHVQLAKDCATFLRRNIVQGVKVGDEGQEDGGTWHLRINSETELGDNESIKNPKSMESSRSARRKKPFPDAVLPEPDSSSATVSEPRPMYYSALKKASQNRVKPEICEEDLEESFVRGSGPLDQMMNPGLSKEEMKRARQIERERRRRKKAKKKELKRNARTESNAKDL